MRVITVRVPDEIHQALRARSRNKGTSMNDLFNSFAARYLKEEAELELFDGFELLGENTGESTVEYAFAAQAEAVMRSE